MKFFPLSAVCLLLTACSNIPTAEYKDTSHLEVPPTSKIYKPKPSEEAEKIEQSPEKKGLGDIVSIADRDQQSVLIIDKSFDRAWVIVNKALELSELEVTDRNRDEGIYDINYDPDTFKGDDTTGAITFFIFGDDYEEGSYKLIIVEKDNRTNVTAMLKPPEIDPALNEDKEDIEEPEDASAKLIKALYLTIRDELPDDF